MFTEEFFLLFEHDNRFLTELVHFDNVYQHPLFDIENGQNSLIFTYFDLLYREYERENCYDKALHSLLFLLLSEVRRLCEKQPLTDATKHRAHIFRQFLSLLDNHFHSHWTAEDYAKSLHLSPRHLNRILNEMTGQSLSDIIRNRLILESKRLLTFSGLPIAQIAQQLGFEDAAYFARYFRKAVGTPPTDFRESLSEKYHK
jgi:AraC-like DNA-binding protein